MEAKTPRGISCPTCGGVLLKVISGAKLIPGVKIRYRKCASCGSRIKTRETVLKVSAKK